MTGLGVCCALGDGLDAVLSSVESGASGLRPADNEMAFLPISGVGHADVDVRPLLKRRKDRKLLPRAAHLAIIAAHQAYGSDRDSETAVFMGVGREPPEVETESAIVASMSGGRLDPDKLYTDGVAAYPPLAPLKTLPNLVLAHVAIQLGCMGEGGTRAGTASSGIAALIAGAQAVAEGRCEVALAGAADSLVAPGLARDALRTGQLACGEAPGEAAAFIRFETRERAQERQARVYGVMESSALGCGELPEWGSPLRGATGLCGVADAPLWVVLEVARGLSGTIQVGERTGAWSTMTWHAVH